jgi:hypothetical protein
MLYLMELQIKLNMLKVQCLKYMSVRNHVPGDAFDVTKRAVSRRGKIPSNCFMTDKMMGVEGSFPSSAVPFITTGWRSCSG